MRFVDRHDAGRRLAADLASRPLSQPVVIALPRGGVPVAADIAARLGAPLDVLVVRKLGYPAQPELGVGAIAEHGMRILNEPLINELGLSMDQIEGITTVERAELRRRVRRYRGARPALRLGGRTAILVDDGLASGFTARTGIEVLRRQRARRIILAVPVGPAHTVRDLRAHADEVVCLRTPPTFVAIGRCYSDFRPVNDNEVVDVLERHATATALAHG